MAIVLTTSFDEFFEIAKGFELRLPPTAMLVGGTTSLPIEMDESRLLTVSG